MKLFKVVFAALLIGTAARLFAADADLKPNEMFSQANQAYEKGDLDKALEIYQGLYGQGFESAALFYNLGNTYYRKGERGKAVLWYERALTLAPRDVDAQFNLELATSHIKENESSLLRKVFLVFTGNELSWILTIAAWVFFGFVGAVILGWVRFQIGPQIVLWASGSLLILAGAWFGIYLYLSAEPWGVITNPPGEVRNGPGQDYAVGFTVPEGSRVLILNRRPDWTQVGVPSQGLKGWIVNSDVEAVTSSRALSG